MDVDFILGLSKTSERYRSPTINERNDWIKQTKFVLSSEIMTYLGRPLTGSYVASTYIGPLTLAQQAEIVQDLCDDNFLGKKQLTIPKYAPIPRKSIRIGSKYQAIIINT